MMIKKKIKKIINASEGGYKCFARIAILHVETQRCCVDTDVMGSKPSGTSRER